jgi:hypothetical protein
MVWQITIAFAAERVELQDIGSKYEKSEIILGPALPGSYCPKGLLAVAILEVDCD